MELQVKTLSDDALYVERDDKTKVYYYLFDEYEVHFDCLPVNAFQDWHFHTKIEEVICVTSGKLVCKYYKNNKKLELEVSKGELIQVKNAIHTLTNPFDEDCEFVVFRLVLNGKRKRDLIRHDKVQVALPKE